MTSAAALEAILFVADAPVSSKRLSTVLGIPLSEVESELGALSHRLESPHRGLCLEKVAGGWRLYTRGELSGYVESFVTRGPIRKLSAAAQEVLAVIAYRQPVSRNQINDIRGVDSSSPLRTLEKTGLIEVVGRLQVPGYPVLYGTTDLLLEKLGLDSLHNLPPLSDLVPAPKVVDELAAATFVSG
ncbi:MAG: SMC-Scp complex subunit ScpB [Actinomycetia bacterium]|nr:SMC-Scp complex subunit ScpB [Actinomycetes bacterium]